MIDFSFFNILILYSNNKAYANINLAEKSALAYQNRIRIRQKSVRLSWQVGSLSGVGSSKSQGGPMVKFTT